MKSLVLALILVLVPSIATAGEWVVVKAPNNSTKFDGYISEFTPEEGTVSIDFYADSTYDYQDGIFRSGLEETAWRVYGHNTNTDEDFYLDDWCLYETEDDGRGVILTCTSNPDRHFMIPNE